MWYNNRESLIMSFKFIFFVILFSFSVVNAQELDSLALEQEEKFMFMVVGDSSATDAISLDEVYIIDKIKFPNKTEYRKYLILKRKTRKVYPYAKMASDTLNKVVADLKDINKKRKRKKYIRKLQNFLEDELTPELKKLTRTEGQILVKLIHRQTDITMYDLIKEYRSGFRAFVYDQTAHLFNISLKKEFEPKLVFEDYLIEDILQRSFQDGVLEKQKPATSIDFYALVDQWESYYDEIGVE